MKSRNYLDTSLKQYKHKNSGKDWYTLIEQSPTLIKQLPTTIEWWFILKEQLFIQNSRPGVCISKMGFTSKNLLLLISHSKIHYCCEKKASPRKWKFLNDWKVQYHFEATNTTRLHTIITRKTNLTKAIHLLKAK